MGYGQILPSHPMFRIVRIPICLCTTTLNGLQTSMPLEKGYKLNRLYLKIFYRKTGNTKGENGLTKAIWRLRKHDRTPTSWNARTLTCSFHVWMSCVFFHKPSNTGPWSSSVPRLWKAYLALHGRTFTGPAEQTWKAKIMHTRANRHRSL